MITDGGAQVCTGTLIAPNLVLTARHCLADHHETEDACGSGFSPARAAQNFAVALGTYADPKKPAAKGKRIFHEKADASACSADMALLLLDKNLETMPRAKVRFDSTVAGALASTVGYGFGSDGKPTKGRNRRDGLKIGAVGPATVLYQTQEKTRIELPIPKGMVSTGESTCSGDSGGPLFDKLGRIIGVTGGTAYNTCVDRPVVFGTTASHAALIREAMSAAGYPLP
jgi:Trypsin